MKPLNLVLLFAILLSISCASSGENLKKNNEGLYNLVINKPIYILSSDDTAEY